MRKAGFLVFSSKKTELLFLLDGYSVCVRGGLTHLLRGETRNGNRNGTKLKKIKEEDFTRILIWENLFRCFTPSSTTVGYHSLNSHVER